LIFSKLLYYLLEIGFQKTQKTTKMTQNWPKMSKKDSKWVKNGQ